MNRIINKLRNLKKKINRLLLKNTSPSIIASNCNGGVMCNDLHLRFNSPFVNLWMKPKDFLKMLENLQYYLKQDLVFVKEENVDYPVGRLCDVTIYFMHYASEEEAVEKWNKRLKRIDYNNLFILFTDRDGCTYEDIKRFEELPYKNKVIFTNKRYPEFKSAFYMKGFETEESVGVCSAYTGNYSLNRYYDQFNYVKWFNGNMN